MSYRTVFVVLAIVATAHLATDDAFGQVREFFLHDRGMLHESVYNNGIIAQPVRSRGVEETSHPMMEWPAHSATVVNSIQYSGQHNSYGGGLWIYANPEGELGLENRIFSFNGVIGSGSPERSIGVWTFPLEFTEIRNYPFLEDGSLNPDYDPNEAEQIIKGVWATNSGIQVTRVSRQWSYPDYDDLIIYEYTLEYTGNTDEIASTIEQEFPLQDVLITFIMNLAPSMFGLQRTYNTWKFRGGIHRGDNFNWYDPDYWLSFNMDRWTDGDEDRAGKPEPDIDLFRQFAESGRGALHSPQAPGMAILHFDRRHLTEWDTSAVDLEDPSTWPSEYTPSLNDWELDENGALRQPYQMTASHGQYDSQVLIDNGSWVNAEGRRGLWREDEEGYDTPNSLFTSEQYAGRGSFNHSSSQARASRQVTFGPYSLEIGDEIKFSVAEVIGYGAHPGKWVMGGQEERLWNEVPSWNRRYEIDGEVVTEAYLDDFGYPDYVNSSVRNVTQVAHKAFEAYTGVLKDFDPETGRPVGERYWPSETPDRGVYEIPVPPPSPVITVVNTATGDVRLNWSTAADEFSHPRLTGKPVRYTIWRSFDAVAWDSVGSVPAGELGSNGQYEYLDDDDSFRVGETAFYGVTASDANGTRGARHAEMVRHKKNVGAVDELGEVRVVPNPFYVESGFQGAAAEGEVGFYGLPDECTIDVYSVGGQLIDTIEHDAPTYSVQWPLVSRNGDALASGVYIYVVKTPEGRQTRGKLVIIK